MIVQTRIEARRGCGYRRAGGIYLMEPPIGRPCCKLPLPLTTCPCCGVGIKPSRGWTWIDVHKLFWLGGYDEYHDKCLNSGDWTRACPLSRPESIDQKAGLLWIGEAFYKTPEEFLSEARQMGISRRINTVPKGFEPDKTWILLAHRKAITITNSDETLDKHPGIFSIFKPSAIEYVTHGDETEAELERIVKRGLTPVEVNPRRAYG